MRVDDLSTDSFKVFFTGKVDAIRAKTESVTSPSITVQEVPPLDLFQEVTSDSGADNCIFEEDRSNVDTSTTIGISTLWLLIF